MLPSNMAGCDCGVARNLTRLSSLPCKCINFTNRITTNKRRWKRKASFLFLFSFLSLLSWFCSLITLLVVRPGGGRFLDNSFLPPGQYNKHWNMTRTESSTSFKNKNNNIKWKMENHSCKRMTKKTVDSIQKIYSIIVT